MNDRKSILQGITWDHSRGFMPMIATAQRFCETHPGVSVRWHKHSLQEFADKPVDLLAEEFDLLVIDHPWTGFAAAKSLFLPLEDHLPSAVMKDLEENSVGPSFQSYAYQGHQWALPIDAAAPVASSRPDILNKLGIELPKNFEELLTLASRGLVVIPAIPVDTLMNFYMFCSALGEDPFLTDKEVVSLQTGSSALKLFRELTQKLDPRCFNWNPIEVYERMTNTDKFAYCPFAYGYSNYARHGYSRKRLCFRDMISLEDGRPLRSIIGGTGIAISAAGRHIDIALEYIRYVTAASCQRTIYFDSGGQPAHLTAWKDHDTNDRCGDFFELTLPALKRSYLRPRYNGYIHFQDNAGPVIRNYLMQGGKEEKVLKALNQLYHKSML